MTKKFYLILIIIFCKFYLNAQPKHSAFEMNSFNLKADNLGPIANSVNLFTGDLNLPINLVSIQGRNDLGIDVTIKYNSNDIGTRASTWNQDAPTGILGLGWELDFPKIVVDNKSTAARDDDNFYLIDEDRSYELVCIGNSSGVKSYQTKIFKNWLITYTSSIEKWEVIKEDGKKYVYGDQNSGRSTVQWLVKWNNWIGNNHTWNYQRQGYEWNLSELISAWGERITYTYLNTEYTVGQGTVLYTQASYLYKVNDSWGHEAEFVYKNKLATEYVDPHSELAEPDAYQERYEQNYLDKIIVRTDAIPYYETQFKYATNILGTGNLTKRLLKSIVRVTPAGSQSPAYFFNYLTSGPMLGALYEVKNSLGGVVSFDYEDETGIDVKYSERYKYVNPTDFGYSNYTEPNVLIRDDYVVTGWRSSDPIPADGRPFHYAADRPAMVLVHTWDGGGWKAQDLGSIGNVRLKDFTGYYPDSYSPDYLLNGGQRFFAILKPTYNQNYHNLYLWSKDETKAGKWILKEIDNLVIDDASNKNIIIGDKFVAIVGNTTTIYTYYFNGVDWLANPITITSGAKRNYQGCSNYLWVHNATPNPDVISFYYLDETGVWSTPKNITAPFDANSSPTLWYPNNSSILGLISGSTQYIYNWDETYSSFSAYNTNVTYDNSTYVMPYSSSFHVQEFTNRRKQSYAFNGNTWVSSGSINFNTTSFTYEGQGWYDLDKSENDGVFAWTKSDVAGSAFLRLYDPNTSTWQVDKTFSSSNTICPELGLNYLRISNSIYFKNPTGVYSLVGSLSPTFTGFESRFGTNYLLYKPSYNGDATSGYNTYIQYVKNGQFLGSAISKDNKSYLLRDEWLGENVFVLGSDGNHSADKGAVYLYRNCKFGHEGTIKDYPVKKVTVNNGIDTETYTSYTYEPTTASFDPSGLFAQYNKVTTIPGSASPSVKPYGYTEDYFFNGLSESELGGEVFPTDASIATSNRASSNYKILNGESYHSKIFDASGSLVTENTFYWQVESLPINSIATPTVRLDTRYVSTPFKIKNLKDGIEVQSVRGYNATTRQLSNEAIVTTNSSGTNENKMLVYIYAWERYTSCLQKNILSPQIEINKIINNSCTESSVTRWKDWPCTGSGCLYSSVPSPVDQFLWSGTGTCYFSYWDATSQTPSSDWTLDTKITSRDNSNGFALESKGRGDQFTCSLLDQAKRNVIASVSNAMFNDVAYSSFEDQSNGNWTSIEGVNNGGNAKTGTQYLSLGTTGITKSGLNSSSTYTLTFWAKSNGGSITIDGIGTIALNYTDWTLCKYTITNLASFSIKRVNATEVQIDEIRLCPSNARMNTKSYHPFFGATAVTDSNNRTVYFDFDDFGRVKNQLDENRNILKSFSHNFKK